jgi:hypothetical protein
VRVVVQSPKIILLSPAHNETVFCVNARDETYHPLIGPIIRQETRIKEPDQVQITKAYRPTD